MDEKLYKNHLAILKQELKVALGCTEPIAIAYVAARAREVLEDEPVSCVVRCSGNIIKNVKGVTVPNSGGQRGVEVAAVLGLLGGDASRELAVLETVTPAEIELARRLIDSDYCRCELVEGVENLFIQVILSDAQGNTALVEARQYHSNITLIQKNGQNILSREESENAGSDRGDKSLLTVDNILKFAECVRLDDVREVLERQIEYNSAISREGLAGDYGVHTGQILMAHGGKSDLRIRTCAATAAGSDARMSGCPLPVVINSGSGNQGITVVIPLVEYANANRVSREKLLRALVVANLIALHQKWYIGSLSAYCGAVSAACGAAVGIAYMLGESRQVMENTITNTIATIGGMVCDGAKSSCAAKISAAVNCALNSLEIARAGHAFQPGEGLVKGDVESTIKSVGRMGRVGMSGTDVEILHIMLEDRERLLC